MKTTAVYARIRSRWSSAAYFYFFLLSFDTRVLKSYLVLLKCFFVLQRMVCYLFGMVRRITRLLSFKQLRVRMQLISHAPPIIFKYMYMYTITCNSFFCLNFNEYTLKKFFINFLNRH